MVTLGELFDELDFELEDMLDVLSQAIDLIEDGKVKEGVEVLKALEEDMFDFLDYVDVGEEELDIVVDGECAVDEDSEDEGEEDEVEEKPAPKKKSAPKKAPAKGKGKK
jgi:hypothetical protein